MFVENFSDGFSFSARRYMFAAIKMYSASAKTASALG